MSQDIEIKAAPRQNIEVLDPIAVLDTGRFEQMQRIASIMARSSLTPEHLRTVAAQDDEGNPIYENGKRVVEHLPYEAIFANCFRIVNQAIRWGLDPFPVAECTSVVRGRLCYEGKLVAGVLDAKLGIELSYEWNDAKGEAYGIVVSGRTQKRGELKSIKGTVGEWQTRRKGSPWAHASNHTRMLAYRGAREWARIHKPALMLGVYTDDEMEEVRGRSISPVQNALGEARAAWSTPRVMELPQAAESQPATSPVDPGRSPDDAEFGTADPVKLEEAGPVVTGVKFTDGKAEAVYSEEAGPVDQAIAALHRAGYYTGRIPEEAGPVDENPTSPSPSTSETQSIEPSGDASTPGNPQTSPTSASPSSGENALSSAPMSQEPARTSTTSDGSTTTNSESQAVYRAPDPIDAAEYEAFCVSWVALCEDRQDARAEWTAQRKLRNKLQVPMEMVDRCKVLIEAAFPREGSDGHG